MWLAQPEVSLDRAKPVRLFHSLLNLALLAVLMQVSSVQAVPSFARQTGQNCVACHAGGQFPELTPYGRVFKMTGYTIGQRTIPLSIMGVASYAKVRDTGKSDDPSTDFQKDGSPIFASGSIFLAGKVTENIGVFAQNTYDNYASQAVEADGSPGRFKGHSQVDNIDIRYADRFIDANRDLIVGVSFNNNPSISDPWNVAPAWMQYVPGASPTSHQFFDGAYPGYGAGGNLAGLTAYAWWNKTVYAEVGAYRTANQALSFMSAGIANADTTHLAGTNPYWRLAYTREWGPHNIMVGTSGMVAHVHDDPTDTTDPNNRSRFRNVGLDSQYQYLLDPHALTAQLAYMRQKVDYSPNSVAAAESPFFLADGVTPVAAPNPADTTNILRAKVSYVYLAKYGGSVSFFNVTGTSNTRNQTSGFDSSGLITTGDPNETGIASTRVNGNLTGSPATRGLVFEAFWTPVQNMRLGAQFTTYSKFNGSSTNYDGFGRDAKDNNTLRIYLWAAY